MSVIKRDSQPDVRGCAKCLSFFNLRDIMTEAADATEELEWEFKHIFQGH